MHTMMHVSGRWAGIPRVRPGCRQRHQGGGAQAGQHGMPVDEHHHGQVVLFIVVSMKESVLLIAVKLEVRGIDVQNDLPQRFLAILDQKIVHPDEVGDDLARLLPVEARGRQLQPVQCALARKRLDAMQPSTAPATGSLRNLSWSLRSSRPTPECAGRPSSGPHGQ